MVRRNMEKIRSVLAELETRPRRAHPRARSGHPRPGDRGGARPRARASSRARRRSASCCPSNSPGVHSLWVPTLALKTALVLKPGSAEPWTPYRLIQAFLQGGRAAARPSASTRPTTRARARSCAAAAAASSSATCPRRSPGRATRASRSTGPGYSKVLLGPDAAEDWPQAPRRHGRRRSLENGGRSCVNASGVWVTGARARDRGGAGRAPGARSCPRAEDDPEAQLAPFANPDVARRISP